MAALSQCVSSAVLSGDLLGKILLLLEVRALRCARVSRSWLEAVRGLHLQVIATVGGNVSGQCGMGSTENTTTMQRVLPECGSGIVTFGCGFYHTCVITQSGQLWTCGRNDHGQCALGFSNLRVLRLSRVPLPAGVAVAQVACGSAHTLLRTVDGALWSCGLNQFGATARPSSRGHAGFLGHVPMPNASLRAMDIACGQHHTCAVMSDQSVWACGINAVGQLGVGRELDQIATWLRMELPHGTLAESCCCGKANTLVLTATGEVWACGWNRYGQCGVGRLTDALRTPERMVVSGAVAKVDAGAVHTCLLMADGTILGCGYEAHGRVHGLPHTAARARVCTPCAHVRAVPACAARARTAHDAQAAHARKHTQAHASSCTCRYNSHGQLAATTFDDASWSAAELQQHASQPSSRRGAAPFFDETEPPPQSSAREIEPLLVLPTPRRLALPISERASDVACGYEHTCIITAAGALWTVGRNNVGQCGLSTTSLREFQVRQVALPPSPSGAGCAAVVSRVVCGKGGGGGHTVCLYS